MNGLAGGTAGRTLRRKQGSPSALRRTVGATIGTVAGPGLAALALVVALLALIETRGGFPEAGIETDNPGGTVTFVAVGGFAWKDGIRSGQQVVELRAADEPDGWQIQTRAPSRSADILVSTQAIHTSALRASWPLAAVALTFAALAVASATRRRRRAELFAALAIAVCAVPMELRGQGIASPATSAMAVIAPALWLVRWTRWPRPARVGLMAGSLLLVAGWAWAIAMASDDYGAIDDIRRGAAFVLAAAVLVGGPGLISVPSLESLRGLRALDLLAGSGLVALIVALQLLAAAPLLVSLIVGVAAVAGYSRWRAIAVESLDRLVLGDLRERASLEAIESERSRLARDLHDEPLQQLAGVIKRLEARPETAEETDLLRAVADQLRSVATELHPPVLDDLGLVPSIEFIAAHHHAGTPITVRIPADVEYMASARPPAAVELAVFRIVQEAVANALEHASCSGILISGTVSAEDVDLRISDDGIGLTGRVVNKAMRDGRLGLASMRRRAEAIDAVVQIEGIAGTGTTVMIRWSA